MITRSKLQRPAGSEALADTDAAAKPPLFGADPAPVFGAGPPAASLAPCPPPFPPPVRPASAKSFVWTAPPPWKPAEEAEIVQHLRQMADDHRQFAAAVTAYVAARPSLLPAHAGEYVLLTGDTFACTFSRIPPVRPRTPPGTVINGTIAYCFCIGEEMASFHRFGAAFPTDADIVAGLTDMAMRSAGQARARTQYLQQRNELVAGHCGEWVAMLDSGDFVLTGKFGEFQDHARVAFAENTGPGGCWLKIGLEYGQSPPAYAF